MENNKSGVSITDTESPVVKLLLLERQRLLGEINRIDRMLGREGVGVQTDRQGFEQATASGRAKNATTKIAALLSALKSANKPLSQKELLLAIQNLGYVFSSRNPINTLNPLLYGDRRLSEVKKVEGGFILAEREKEFAKSSTDQP